VLSELNAQSVTQWQNEWDRTIKGKITKSFFRNIPDRFKIKISVTPNFTTMTAGHGNIKTYLYKDKIIESPMCSCENGEQSVDHILFECKLLEKERDRLIGAVSRYENWPVNKTKVSREYYKNFKEFTKNVCFDKL
jgi:hypothetical protein